MTTIITITTTTSTTTTIITIIIIIIIIIIITSSSPSPSPSSSLHEWQQNYRLLFCALAHRHHDHVCVREYVRACVCRPGASAYCFTGKYRELSKEVNWNLKIINGKLYIITIVNDPVHIFFAGCKVMYSTVIACKAFGMKIYSCHGLASLIRTDYYYNGKSTC